MKSNYWSTQVSVFCVFPRRFLTFVLEIAGRRISAMVHPVPLRDGYMLTLFLSAKAYHVSNNKCNIATVDRGANATIKVWAMRRPSSYPLGQVSDSWLAMVQSVERLVSRNVFAPYEWGGWWLPWSLHFSSPLCAKWGDCPGLAK